MKTTYTVKNPADEYIAETDTTGRGRTTVKHFAREFHSRLAALEEVRAGDVVFIREYAENGRSYSERRLTP